MTIETATINRIGARDNLEDFIFSANLPGGKTALIVCDGVGGQSKGEVASETVARGVADYLMDNGGTAETIQQAVTYAEGRMDQYLQAHPEGEGMATTLVLLLLDEQHGLSAHIGDSRLYHIRAGEILFRTRDHTYTNDLVASGYLTAEEALNDRRKNYLTHAIQGSSEPEEAEIDLIEDIRPGDYFLLCTDGIFEGIDEDFLQRKCLPEADPHQLATDIETECLVRAQDNFSAIIVKMTI